MMSNSNIYSTTIFHYNILCNSSTYWYKTFNTKIRIKLNIRCVEIISIISYMSSNTINKLLYTTFSKIVAIIIKLHKTILIFSKIHFHAFITSNRHNYRWNISINFTSYTTKFGSIFFIIFFSLFFRRICFKQFITNTSHLFSYLINSIIIIFFRIKSIIIFIIRIFISFILIQRIKRN